MAERSIESMTLGQYEFLKERTDDARVVDDDYELKLARGSQAQFDFVEKRRRQNGVIPKPIAAFITAGSRAVEHIHGERHDPQASAQAVGSHNLGGSVLSPPPDPNGPYRDAVLRPVSPYPKRDETGRYPGEWQAPRRYPGWWRAPPPSRFPCLRHCRNPARNCHLRKPMSADVADDQLRESPLLHAAPY